MSQAVGSRVGMRTVGNGKRPHCAEGLKEGVWSQPRGLHGREESKVT